MVETEWPELGGVEVEYGDHTWELTGMVDVREPVNRWKLTQSRPMTFAGTK